jgi:hypothetical protein
MTSWIETFLRATKRDPDSVSRDFCASKQPVDLSVGQSEEHVGHGRRVAGVRTGNSGAVLEAASLCRLHGVETCKSWRSGCRWRRSDGG